MDALQTIFCLYSSCLQVRCPVHSESSEEKHFYWETLFERSEVCKPRIKNFTLPVWAGTWKIMNFAFRQEKPEWDCVWPDYEQPISDKSDKTEELEEEVRTKVLVFIVFFYLLADTDSLVIITQNESPTWEDSWKLSGMEPNLEDTSDEDTLPVEINEFFMPGWSDSWQLAAPPEEHRKIWSICLSYRQQMR